ncbi:MAG: hybrid sensor histidine kinase/response regulator [Myxococcaceae bacterium]
MDDKVNILMVDDHQPNLVALEATLESLKQPIFRAQSGEEALRLMLERDFAVVLLDVVMPGVDGLELARTLRARPRSSKTPIIFLTGVDYDRAKHRVLEAYELGAVDYLVKPFEPVILRSKVAVFVELAQMTAQVRRAAQQERESERKVLAAQAAVNQLRWLESVLDVTPIPLLLLEPGRPQQPLMANRAATMIGRGAFSRPTEPFEAVELRDEDGQVLSAEQWPQARAAGGARLEGEMYTLRTGDDEVTVLAFSERLGALYGQAETVVLTLLDVSQLKRSERALREMIQSREDFIAVGSHELRTPLTALKFQVRNALRAWTKPGLANTPVQSAVSYLKDIDQSVERLVRLSEFLLDVTRLTAERLKLQRAAFDLGEMVEDVLERLKPALEWAKVTAEVKRKGPLMGWWDRARLEQMITNLVENVCRYAPGAPMEIELVGDESVATLTVRDHGKGVPEDTVPRLFQRFSVGTGKPAAGKGFGLGLWIVAQLAQQHGGTIDFAPAQGGGASFTITLPRNTTDPGETAVAPLQRRAQA